jgi:hypothetical protein
MPARCEFLTGTRRPEAAAAGDDEWSARARDSSAAAGIVPARDASRLRCDNMVTGMRAREVSAKKEAIAEGSRRFEDYSRFTPPREVIVVTNKSRSTGSLPRHIPVKHYKISKISPYYRAVQAIVRLQDLQHATWTHTPEASQALPIRRHFRACFHGCVSRGRSRGATCKVV